MKRILLIAGILIASASPNAEAFDRMIYSNGACTKAVVPDRGSITVVATNQDMDLQKASRKSTEAYEKLKAAVRKLNLKDEDLATSEYDLSEVREWEKEKSVFKGFRARMGLSIAETMVELFSGLSPDNPLFEQYSFISADELPNVRLLLQRLGGKGIEAVPPTDLPRLMTLPFRYVEARHRLGLIDSVLEDRLLEARRAFAEGLPDAVKDDIQFYDVEKYNSAGTLQDNILFGRLVYGQAQGETRIGKLIAEVLTQLGLRDAAIEVGLEYNVGVGGKRLPAVQRQKLGIARALIKRPQLLVVNEAVAVFDGRAQDRIRDNILAAAGDRGVFWIANRPSQAEPFEEVVVMQNGRIVAQGKPADLAAQGGLYAELMASG